MSGIFYISGGEGRWPDRLAGAATRFEYEAGMNRAARAIVTMRNEGLTHQDDAILSDGADLAVQFGSEDLTIRRRLRIHQVRGTTTLAVPAYGATADLATGDRWRLWENITASELAAAIARERGLAAAVQFAGTVRHPQIAQAGESDGRLLARLAAEIGWEFWEEDRTLYFRPPDYSAKPAMLLERGRNLDLFEPQEQTLMAPGEVAVRTFDLATKQLSEFVVHQGNAPRSALGPKALRNSASGRLTAWNASPDPTAGLAAARGLYEALERSTVAVKFRAAGDVRIMPGAILQVDGYGTRWNGLYRVTFARHQIAGGKYLVDGYLSRNAAGSVGAGTVSAAQNRNEVPEGRPFATVTVIDLATGRTREEEIR